MKRKPTFTAAEITRAVKAAKAGGMRLVRLEIESGKLIIVELIPESQTPETVLESANEWDSVK